MGNLLPISQFSGIMLLSKIILSKLTYSKSKIQRVSYMFVHNIVDARRLIKRTFTASNISPLDIGKFIS